MRIVKNFSLFSSLVLFICLLIFIFFNFEFGKKVQTDNNAFSPLTLIIDAGHGGVDGGAIASDGTNEKDINLEIATYLNEILCSYGFNTIMTRTEDISIHDKSSKTIREMKVSDIHNRMKILNNIENCIFISIHQNSYEDSKYWGTQVFYSPNTVQSKEIAFEIQESVQNILQNDNDRQIKECGKSVYLLYYAKKPAVLVECGFITNNKELQMLKNEEYQRKMAFSIANGILNYVNKGS